MTKRKVEQWVLDEFSAAAERMRAATARQEQTGEADRLAKSELAEARAEYLEWGHAVDGTGPTPQRRLPGMAG